MILWSWGISGSRAFLLLLLIIAAVGEPGRGVVGGDRGDGLGDRLLEGVHGAGLERTEFLFHFAPALLDGVEVGRVRRQIPQLGSGGLDEFSHSRNFMRRQVCLL